MEEVISTPFSRSEKHGRRCRFLSTLSFAPSREEVACFHSWVWQKKMIVPRSLLLASVSETDILCSTFGELLGQSPLSGWQLSNSGVLEGVRGFTVVAPISHILWSALSVIKLTFDPLTCLSLSWFQTRRRKSFFLATEKYKNRQDKENLDGQF